jgi:hypothetical protein
VLAGAFSNLRVVFSRESAQAREDFKEKVLENNVIVLGCKGNAMEGFITNVV